MSNFHNEHVMTWYRMRLRYEVAMAALLNR